MCVSHTVHLRKCITICITVRDCIVQWWHSSMCPSQPLGKVPSGLLPSWSSFPRGIFRDGGWGLGWRPVVRLSVPLPNCLGRGRPNTGHIWHAIHCIGLRQRIGRRFMVVVTRCFTLFLRRTRQPHSWDRFQKPAFLHILCVGMASPIWLLCARTPAEKYFAELCFELLPSPLFWRMIDEEFRVEPGNLEHFQWV